MEIVLFLLGAIALLTALVVSMENEDKTWIAGTVFVFGIVLVTWLGLTEQKDVELQIHDATSNDTSFNYYVDYESRMIPVPNNTVKVIKTEPRTWSVNLPEYEVIVE